MHSKQITDGNCNEVRWKCGTIWEMCERCTLIDFLRWINVTESRVERNTCFKRMTKGYQHISNEFIVTFKVEY